MPTATSGTFDGHSTRRAPSRPRRRRRPGVLGAARAAALILGVIAVIAATRVLGSDPPGKPNAASPPTSVRRVAACDATVPPPAVPKRYRREPPMRLQPNVDYRARIHTSCGDFELDLFEQRAPRAVNNFVFLTQQGFYDGLIWHHVAYDFIIQTGDANGVNGVAPDGPGYTINDELPQSNRGYVYGAVGFARAGNRDSAGSQFFIVVHDIGGALAGKAEPLEIEVRYTIFGSVDREFYGSLENIARQKTVGGSDPVAAVRPVVPIYVEGIEIIRMKR